MTEVTLDDDIVLCTIFILLDEKKQGKEEEEKKEQRGSVRGSQGGKSGGFIIYLWLKFRSRMPRRFIACDEDAILRLSGHFVPKVGKERHSDAWKH